MLFNSLEETHWCKEYMGNNSKSTINSQKVKISLRRHWLQAQIYLPRHPDN